MAIQKVIDAHHHIWNQQDVPWLADTPKPRIFGDYEAIRRDYLIDEYLADSAEFNVTQSVYVQVNWDPSRAIQEVAWVQSVGDSHGRPNGIIAYADLTDPDLAGTLDTLQEYSMVRGIRQQIHWHRNPDWAYVSVPDMYDNPDWRRGLAAVTVRGLTFDLQIFPSQMKGAARMVSDFPDTIFVLNHAGMLDQRDDNTWRIWREGMQALAKCPNMYVKLSGLNTFDHECLLDLMRPIASTSVELFGAERCMFGSNFPIEKIWTNYNTYCQTLLASLGKLSDAERQAIFHDTAKRIYQIGE